MWVQEEQEGNAFVLWENREPKGTPGANEAPKAPRQRQQAAGAENGVPGWEGTPQQPWPTQDLHPDPQAPLGSQQLPAFSQPPCPFIEHMVPPKCSFGASKECPGASPDPQKVENQGPWAPPCSGNGSSLVSPSIRGWSPGWICLGQGPYYGLRETVRSLRKSPAYSAAVATSSSSASSSVLI